MGTDLTRAPKCLDVCYKNSIARTGLYTEEHFTVMHLSYTGYKM